MLSTQGRGTSDAPWRTSANVRELDQLCRDEVNLVSWRRELPFGREHRGRLVSAVHRLFVCGPLAGKTFMFGPRNDEKRSAAIRGLKTLARKLFEAAEDDAVVVNELRCVEPGCPRLRRSWRSSARGLSRAR